MREGGRKGQIRGVGDWLNYRSQMGRYSGKVMLWWVSSRQADREREVERR